MFNCHGMCMVCYNSYQCIMHVSIDFFMELAEWQWWKIFKKRVALVCIMDDGSSIFVQQTKSHDGKSESFLFSKSR